MLKNVRPFQKYFSKEYITKMKNDLRACDTSACTSNLKRDLWEISTRYSMQAYGNLYKDIYFIIINILLICLPNCIDINYLPPLVLVYCFNIDLCFDQFEILQNWFCVRIIIKQRLKVNLASPYRELKVLPVSLYYWHK